ELAQEGSKPRTTTLHFASIFDKSLYLLAFIGHQQLPVLPAAVPISRIFFQQSEFFSPWQRRSCHSRPIGVVLGGAGWLRQWHSIPRLSAFVTRSNCQAR